VRLGYPTPAHHFYNDTSWKANALFAPILAVKYIPEAGFLVFWHQPQIHTTDTLSVRFQFYGKNSWLWPVVVNNNRLCFVNSFVPLPCQKKHSFIITSKFKNIGGIFLFEFAKHKVWGVKCFIVVENFLIICNHFAFSFLSSKA